MFGGDLVLYDSYRGEIDCRPFFPRKYRSNNQKYVKVKNKEGLLCINFLAFDFLLSMMLKTMHNVG